MKAVYDKLSEGQLNECEVLSVVSKQAALYLRSSSNLEQNISYRCLYDAFTNSGSTLKCGERAITGIVDLGQSSKTIKYPNQGAG